MNITRTQIKDKVLAKEITNVICLETKKPIMLNESYYHLDTEMYHKECDIDVVLKNVTNGQYNNLTEYLLENCDEDDNFYYQSAHEDIDGIVEDIIDNEGFYDREGNFNDIVLL